MKRTPLVLNPVAILVAGLASLTGVWPAGAQDVDRDRFAPREGNMVKRYTPGYWQTIRDWVRQTTSTP